MYKKLVLVQTPTKAVEASKLGHNKFYEMKDNGDGTFTVSYGRIGGHVTSRTYTMSKWNSTLRSKLRKGYIDVTPTAQLKDVSFTGLSNQVAKLLDALMRHANQHVTNTYFVTGADVTQADIDLVQGYLDQAMTMIQAQEGLNNIADLLIQTYTKFPRTMANVADHIPTSFEQASRILDDELDNLATLQSQVQQISTQDDEFENPLESMGLSIVEYTGETISIPYRRAFTVTNKNTSQRFIDFLNGRKPDFRGIHGSRNRNIWPILQQGLRIRPSGAGSNGSLYGNGIYFADDYRKAKSYTGDYLMLFDVFVGKQYKAQSTNSRLGLDTINGADSVLANHGYNEYIVYRPNQCTIATLLEI